MERRGVSLWAQRERWVASVPRGLVNPSLALCGSSGPAGTCRQCLNCLRVWDLSASLCTSVRPWGAWGWKTKVNATSGPFRHRNRTGHLILNTPESEPAGVSLQRRSVHM